jgi:large subunit ribosomal protein L25
MQTIEIKAFKRENVGKVATKELRAAGNVPCVLYGGKDVIHFYAAAKDFNKLLFTPIVYIVKLNVEGTVYDAIIKDIQYHPVSDAVIHADFLYVFDDKPIVIELPVKLTGMSEGVKAGGKLNLEQRKLRVRGLVKDLPEELLIDITHLGLNKGIQVLDIEYPNIELLNAKNSVVVSVKLTRAAIAAQQKG